MTEQTQTRHIVIDDNEIFIQYPLFEGGATFAWDWVDNCRSL